MNLEVLEKSTLKDFDYIKFMLNEKEPEILTNKMSAQASIEDAFIAFPLKSGYLGGQESASYTLRLWLDENTPTDTKYMNKLFASKISIVSLNYPKEIDKTPPIASFTATQVEGGYLVDARGSTDDNSGIAKYYYSKDGENWITSTEDNYVFKDDAVLTSGKATDVIESISSSKVYDIYVKVEDKFENMSEVVTKNVKTRELNYDDTLDKNLRYISSNSNNYVLFNNESWRIIGVMNHMIDKEGQQNTHLKIERLTPYNSIFSTTSSNWTTSTVLAGMNAYYDGLSTENQNMVSEVMWNVGNASGFAGIGALKTYELEKQRPTWLGKIGLSTLSDYRYASWTQFSYRQYTMFYNSSNQTVTIGSGISIMGINDKLNSHFTVYVHPEVKIVSGNGSSSNPFVLE